MLTLSPPLLLFAELVISCLAVVLWLLSSCFHSAASVGGDIGGPYKRRRKLWEYRANTVLNIQRESRTFRPNRNSSTPVSKTQYSHWCFRHTLNLLAVHNVYSPLNSDTTLVIVLEDVFFYPVKALLWHSPFLSEAQWRQRREPKQLQSWCLTGKNGLLWFISKFMPPQPHLNTRLCNTRPWKEVIMT